MRGWVYIITNKSMPGLVKVGYSTKDPHLRAEELNHTGSPHPYETVYDVLVMSPHQIEQQVHKLLGEKNEGKEWFKCSISEAVKAIKEISGTSIILENVSPKYSNSLQTEKPDTDHLYSYQRSVYCPYCNDKNPVPTCGTIILTCSKCGRQSSHDYQYK